MQVTIREVTPEDLPIMLAWAHIKEIWEWLPTSRKGEVLTWENHFNWWQLRVNRLDWMIMVETDEYGPRPVGIVIVNLKSLELGIYIGEVMLWGQGVARRALSQVIMKLTHQGHTKFCAMVHPKNERSQALFTGLGFIKVGKGRRDQDLYELDLNTHGGPEVTVSAEQTRDKLCHQPSVG